MDLRSRVLRYIRARNLIQESDAVLVAVSGGVDSMVLLDILASEFSVVPAHFDHAMRSTSAEEAARLASICADRYGVALYQERSKVQLRGETDARAARYRFLDEALRSTRCTVCALGHHADDQVETVLFRMMRGTGMRGLSGMPLRRGAYVRPLLPFSRAEILAFAEANDIEFIEDASNADIKYARNRIRHVFMPALEAIKPGSRKALLKLSRTAARVEKTWRGLLDAHAADVIRKRERASVVLDRAGVLALDEETRTRILRRLVRRFGVVPSRATTRHLDAFVANAESGSVLKLGAVAIERNFDELRVGIARDATNEELWLDSPAGDTTLRMGGRTYRVRWLRSPTTEQYDLQFPARRVQLRGFRPGDRIRLPYGTKKLKKVLAEARIPAAERSSIPLLVDENGEVLYVHGIARSVDAMPTDSVLNITVTNAESS